MLKGFINKLKERIRAKKDARMNQKYQEALSAYNDIRDRNDPLIDLLDFKASREQDEDRRIEMRNEIGNLIQEIINAKLLVDKYAPPKTD